MHKRCVYLTVIVLLLITNSVNARPWFARPGLTMTLGYDDNLTLESDAVTELNNDSFVDDDADNIGDQGFVFIGGDVRFSSETGGDLIAIDLSASARRYNESDLDSETFDISALYNRDGIKNSIALEAGFLRASTIETELEDTGVLEENFNRDEVFIDSELTKSISEQWEGVFTLGYNDVSFDTNSGQFTNYEQYKASAKLNKIFSERLTAFGLINFTSFKPTELVEVNQIEQDDFTSVQLGVNYNLTEQLVGLISVGRGFIDTNQFEENGSVSFSETTTVYNLELNYTGERNTIGAVFSNTFDSSADGGLSETQSFSLLFNRPETFGGVFGIKALYILRDPIRGDTSTRDYYQLASGMSWEISQNFTVSSLVRFREQEIEDADTNIVNSADSSSITVDLRYDFGRKRISY